MSRMRLSRLLPPCKTGAFSNFYDQPLFTFLSRFDFLRLFYFWFLIQAACKHPGLIYSKFLPEFRTLGEIFFHQVAGGYVYERVTPANVMQFNCHVCLLTILRGASPS